MTRIEQAIARLREAREKATAAPWSAKWSDQDAIDIITAISASIGKGGKQWHWLYGPYIADGDSSPVITAETGNGPTSAANAAFIAISANVWSEICDCLDESARFFLTHEVLGCGGHDGFGKRLEALASAVLGADK